MSQVSRHVRAARSDVFDVLVRPETYPEWLVGCRDIRDIDDSWPEPGSRFHHRFGLVGPFAIPDNTEVLEIEKDRRLSLEVRLRPLGRGRATFILDDAGDDDGRPVTKITLDEVPLGSLAPLTPLLDPLTVGRNIPSLNALVAYLNTPAAFRSKNRARAGRAPDVTASSRSR